MPTGTKGFYGDRLREAREARSLTGVALAELAGVSTAVISQYERGSRTPQPVVLEQIADKLNLPVAFFLRAPDDDEEGVLFFRSHSGTTKMARRREVRRFQWHVQIERFLRSYALLPEVDFPKLYTGDPLALRDEDLEELAASLRKQWQLGDEPIPDLVEHLEAMGAIVSRCELGAVTLDAYSGWKDDVPHIILGADKMAAVRSRFDAAHELCHLTLHGSVPSNVLNSSTGLKELERQAHLFAGAFLLPPKTFAGDIVIPMLDSLLSIKPRWGVSVGAMIQRARTLELISPEQQQRMWISYRRRWGRREPYDADLPIEAPTTLRAAFELLRDARVGTAGEMRVALPYAATDIEQLAGLPRGFLGSWRSTHVQLTDTPAAGKGVLLQFPRTLPPG